MATLEHTYTSCTRVCVCVCGDGDGDGAPADWFCIYLALLKSFWKFDTMDLEISAGTDATELLGFGSRRSLVEKTPTPAVILCSGSGY